MMRPSLVVLAAVTLWSSVVCADTIYLKNGSAIDCMVIGKRDDMVVLMIGNLGRMTIPEKDIKIIEKNSRTGYVNPERGGNKERDSKVKPDALPEVENAVGGVISAPDAEEEKLTEEEQKQLKEWVFELTRQQARKRTRAERQLKQFGPKAIPSLLNVAGVESDWTRAAVFRIFKEIGDIRVAEAALKALADDNRWVRKLAWETLIKVSGQRHPFPWDDSVSEAERDRSRLRWVKWWQAEQRKQADAEAIRLAEEAKKNADPVSTEANQK